MTRFTANGHTYDIVLDLTTLRRVQRAVEIDLLDNDGIRLVTRSTLDFVEMLWHVVESQAERQGVSQEAFFGDITPILDECISRWLDAFTRLCSSLNRSALATFARTLIDAERVDRDAANRTMTEANAKELLRVALTRSSMSRRQAVEAAIGRDFMAAAGNEPGSDAEA